MDERHKNITQEEQEIDLIELAKKIWGQRRLVLMVCGIALIVALVVIFSIPKSYTTKVKLAPELGSNRSGAMGLLASMSGINLRSQDIQSLSPDAYPDIMQSTPFLMGLFDIRVKDKQQDIDTTFYAYMNEYQRKTWWSYITSAPFKLLALILPRDAVVVEGAARSSRLLVISKRQAEILSALNKKINIDVDKMTGNITLSSSMQSPVISAMIADTITSYLQNYIISYRTKKARVDLNFAEALYLEAQKDYYKAQQAYATYVDENVGIISARYRTTQERLQNEMSLAYGVYNQVAQQLQLARVKVQDMTPVYTVVQPAVVPLKPSKPRKMMILVGFVFLAFVGSCGWILVKDSFQL